MSSPEASLWSIRRRLTITLSAALGVVLAVLFVALDHWIENGVYGHLDAVLANQARTVANGLRHGGQMLLGHLLPEYDLPGHTEFFTVYDRDGRKLLSSSNSRGMTIPLPAQGDSLPAYYDVRTPDGHHGRAFAVPLTDSPGQLLVVATERAEWDAAERRIHYALVAGIALAVGVVILLVHLVVRRAFTPLLQQGARIAALSADRPPQSTYQDLPSELAPIAAAFDSGLGRLYDAIERERRLSRDIAHELRTPLAETRAAAEVALRDGAAPALRTGLGTAIAATERMQRSVDTLLALARFESGQESPALDPLDISSLAATQVQVLRRFAESRKVSLRLQAPPETSDGAWVGAWVHSDIGIVERILTNLLQNAVDYAPPGSEVLCSIASEGSGHSIVIDNAAPQLTPEDLAHFGTRFWRKPHEGGTAQHAGLGLALAFALARSLALKLEFGLVEGRLRARLGPFPAL